MEADAIDQTLNQAQARRKRPRPGERREQILQCLAAMLEKQGADRITTAALAQQLQVSEAALYRHFASKAQMFEALIEFIETSMFGLVNQIATQHESGLIQAARTVHVFISFAERNPGLCRVMSGDALVGENGRLQLRMDQFFERIEAALRQSLRLAQQQGAVVAGFDAVQRAHWLFTYASGCLLRLSHGATPGSESSAAEPAVLRLLA